MDSLGKSLQENILVLLCFDDDRASFIRNVVPLELYDRSYRVVADKIYSYIDAFKTAPKEHVADELEDVLNTDDTRKAQFYKELLFNIYSSRSSINSEYVVSRLSTFLKQQYLKSGIINAAEVLQSGQTDALDKAESVLNEALKHRFESFDPGLFLTEDRAFRFLDEEESSFPTGIKEFDSLNIGPIRGGLSIFIALPKRGKTWWLTNLGKRAVIRQLKVCHVTLEMDEYSIAQRYFQAFFAASKRNEDISQITFEVDNLGRIIDFERDTVRAKLSFDQPDVITQLDHKRELSARLLRKIVIKQFPTGQLTINQLQAYLDNLEFSKGFVPDLLIVDYADLMYVDSRSYRTDLGRIYKELRGIGVERNIAIATASQSNREGLSSKLITEGNIAEDFSKIATADSIITYSQTADEKALGLARLYVLARGDKGSFSVIISQNYSIGQFVINSARMIDHYWELLKDQDNAV